MIENNGILTLKEVENIKIDPERDFYSATPEEIKRAILLIYILSVSRRFYITWI